MGRELTPTELHELLGAYALDALDGDELIQVEEWLERSPEARDEVAALRETVALLAYGGAEAPPTLWSRIEESLGEEPPAFVLPLAPAPTLARSRRRSSVALRVTAALAVASAVAAGVTAVVVSDKMSRQDDRLSQVAAGMEHASVRHAAEVAANDPHARHVQLVSDDESMSADVAVMPNGEGYLIGHGVPQLPKGRTYQLWAMTGDAISSRVISAGVLGRSFDVAAFRAPASAHGFMITDEAMPGAVRSAHEPMLHGEV
jgi:hypothetical protein